MGFGVPSLHLHAVAIAAAQLGALSCTFPPLLPLYFPPCAPPLQINFLALYHLLSFGSGWDRELLLRSKRDAAETVQYGLLGLAICGQRIDHHFMKAGPGRAERLLLMTHQH